MEPDAHQDDEGGRAGFPPAQASYGLPTGGGDAARDWCAVYTRRMERLVFLARLATCWIPLRGWRRELRRRARLAAQRWTLRHAIASVEAAVAALRRRVAAGEKVRVAFQVIYESAFPGEGLYRLMQQDPLFEPFIIALPDVTRGARHQAAQYQRTLAALAARHGQVMAGYDPQTGAFVDLAPLCDLSIPAMPYSAMTAPQYAVENLAARGIPSLLLCYGYMPVLHASHTIIPMNSMQLFWKIITHTREEQEEFRRHSCRHGANTALLGYAKMDALAAVPPEEIRPRKRIVIAPHHTVAWSHFPLSNFLRMADFILELPRLYPQIDWVFRPHQLLYPTLCREDVWGPERTRAWFASLQGIPNLTWQNGGSYMETFVHSDGMIHDCSSFLVEYLLTGHPGCYVLHSPEQARTLFNRLGQRCLEHYDLALSREDIIRFIDEVILQGKDARREQRLAYVAQALKTNYPHATESILATIKQELMP